MFAQTSKAKVARIPEAHATGMKYVGLRPKALNTSRLARRATQELTGSLDPGDENEN